MSASLDAIEDLLAGLEWLEDATPTLRTATTPLPVRPSSGRDTAATMR